MIWTRKKKEKSKAEISLENVNVKILEMLRNEDAEFFSLAVTLLMEVEKDPVKQDHIIRQNIRRDAIEFYWKVDIFGGARDFEAKPREKEPFSTYVSAISSNSTLSYSVSNTHSLNMSALSITGSTLSV